jgi:hypothetical protein
MDAGFEGCYSWNNTNDGNRSTISTLKNRASGAAFITSTTRRSLAMRLRFTLTLLLRGRTPTPTPQPTSTRLHQCRLRRRPRLPPRVIRPSRIRLSRPIRGSGYSRLSLHVQRKMLAWPWEARLSPYLPMFHIPRSMETGGGKVPIICKQWQNLSSLHEVCLLAAESPKSSQNNT